MMKPSGAFVAYLIAAALAPFLQAQTPPTSDSGSRAQPPSAAAAMETSLAKQRSSVRQQTGQGESSGFFVLPPPAKIGATYVPTVPLPAMSDLPAPKSDCDPLPSARVDSLVTDAARHSGLDEALLRGVMRQESGFRPCAVSPKGAMGLMQLMPATADQFGVNNPFDPVDNVEAGAKLLKELMTRYNGDLTRVLGAYNAGPARVDEAGGLPNIPETINYVRRILSLFPIPGH